jgi:hypothetical protein
VVTPAANVADGHTLFIKSSVSAVFASAKWHTVVNFQALQRLLGKTGSKKLLTQLSTT